MAQFEEQYTQDLTQGIKIRQCGNIVFNGDNLSNVIRVSLYNGTTPATLSGTVVGAVICSDGSTVPVDNGTIDGNTVTLTLTEACFAIPGQIGVGIQIVSGTTSTTIFKGIYNVERLTTDNVVDPDSRITLQVGNLIDDIAEARATIPADYTDLMAAVAPIFDTSTAYSTGAYVWYEGELYQFKNNHAAGSWNSSQVIAATVPAFQLIDFVGKSLPFDITFTLGKNISNGTVTNSNYTALSNFLPTSPTFIRTGADTDGNGVALSMFVHEYDSTQTWLRRTALNATDGKIMHPQSDCAYVRIVFGRASSTGINIAQSDIDNYFGIDMLISMRQVVANIKNINTSLAPTFSPSTAYTSGQYVWHDGNLYQFTTNHAASGWGTSPVVDAVVGEDISKLKNAVGIESYFDFGEWQNGWIRPGGTGDAAGTIGSATKHLIAGYNGSQIVQKGDGRTWKISVKNGWALMNIGEYTTKWTSSFTQFLDLSTNEVTLLSDKYYCFDISKTSNETITPSDVTDDTIVFAHTDYTDKTLTMSGKAADAKVVGDRMSELDSIGAQVLYTAMMTDTLLEGGD